MIPQPTRRRLVGVLAGTLVLFPGSWATASQRMHAPAFGTDTADVPRIQASTSPHVPRSSSQEASRLLRERDQLLAEKEQAAKDAEEWQRTRAAVEEELGDVVEDLRQSIKKKLAFTAQLAQENAALTAQRADETAVLIQGTDSTQRGTLLLALVCVGLLGWILKLHADSRQSTGKVMLLTQEHAALKVAKEKYQYATAQLERRGHDLYYADTAAPAASLALPFAEGCAKMEQLLTSIRTEREKAAHGFPLTQKIVNLLFHPRREVLQRYRFNEV